MKKVTRAELRGKPLNRDCYKANTTTGEYGKEDNRVFCYGLYKDKMEELREECLNCKAYVMNAEPLKKETVRMRFDIGGGW